MNNKDNPISTTRPPQPGDTKSLTPEFARIDDIHQMFGLKRGSLYNLIRDGKVKSVLTKVTGRKSGIRLIEVASVRQYILSGADSGGAQ